MKVTTAILILDCLRNGLDPTTGLALRDDSPMHDPEVRSALDLALGSLQYPVEQREEEDWHRFLAKPPEQANHNIPKRKKHRPPKIRRASRSAIIARSLTGQREVPKEPKPAKPPNQGKPWSPEHAALLVREYKEGTSIKELATELGRGVRAIELKLYNLGLLPSQRLPRTQDTR